MHGLDAIRGIAALVVVFHHLATFSGRAGFGELPFFAVDLFFVLSGFVMTRTYEPRLRHGHLTTISFVAIRYRRLFLPLAIGTTLGVSSALFRFGPSIEYLPAYALALLFLPAFWMTGAFLFNVPAWSLFIEIATNAIHGALLAKRSVRTLLVLLIANAALTIGLLSIGLAHWGEGIVPILSCIPRELSFYIAGILLFRIFGDAPFDFARGQWTVWLGSLSYPLYATHAPVLHLVLGAGLPPITALMTAFGLAWLLAVSFERKRHCPGSARVADIEAAIVGGGPS